MEDAQFENKEEVVEEVEQPSTGFGGGRAYRITDKEVNKCIALVDKLRMLPRVAVAEGKVTYSRTLTFPEKVMLLFSKAPLVGEVEYTENVVLANRQYLEDDAIELLKKLQEEPCQ